MLVSLALSSIPSAVVADPPGRVRLGIEVLLGERIELIEGKRVGLITNPAGVDGALVPTVDRLANDGRFELVQLYGPEHGIRGEVAAGDSVADAVDARTGVPVESLYGARRRPSKESLARIDVLLFDLQDVGVRCYTYISTLGEAMRACAEAKKPLIVLDRPNPLGGLAFEGPVRGDKFASFIGWGPVDNPQFMIYVWIQKPSTSIWSSETAAPVFSQVAEQTVILLNIPPDMVRNQFGSR